MSELATWLTEQALATETITIRGKQFQIRELSYAEQGRLTAEVAGDTDAVVAMMSLAVCDPATSEPVGDTAFWQSMNERGMSLMVPLRRAVVRVNGLADIEGNVKN